MTRYFLFFVLFVGLTACGGGASTDNSAESASTAAADDKTKNPDYQKGLDLITKSDCLTCHKVSEKSIGPSYYEVALKYDDTQENIDKLAATIIQGGTGVWGAAPMTPHPALSEEDAKQMVKYILLLK